eukprot:gene7484-biopygen9278
MGRVEQMAATQRWDNDRMSTDRGETRGFALERRRHSSIFLPGAPPARARHVCELPPTPTNSHQLPPTGRGEVGEHGRELDRARPERRIR